MPTAIDLDVYESSRFSFHSFCKYFIPLFIFYSSSLFINSESLLLDKIGICKMLK